MSSEYNSTLPVYQLEDLVIIRSIFEQLSKWGALKHKILKNILRNAPKKHTFLHSELVLWQKRGTWIPKHPSPAYATDRSKHSWDIIETKTSKATKQLKKKHLFMLLWNVYKTGFVINLNLFSQLHLVQKSNIALHSPSFTVYFQYYSILESSPNGGRFQWQTIHSHYFD